MNLESVYIADSNVRFSKRKFTLQLNVELMQGHPDCIIGFQWDSDASKIEIENEYMWQKVGGKKSKYPISRVRYTYMDLALRIK